MCQHSPLKDAAAANAAKRHGGRQVVDAHTIGLCMLTPEATNQHLALRCGRDDEQDDLDYTYDCETPKVFSGFSGSGVECGGLVARTVPQWVGMEVEEEEPVTPRGAMLPPAPAAPPALKAVNALTPHWERRNHMFDEVFVLSPVKTVVSATGAQGGSPGNVSGVSSTG